MTEYRTVLRVENAEGLGPFSSGQGVPLCDTAEHVRWMTCTRERGFFSFQDTVLVDATHPHHEVDVLRADVNDPDSYPRLPGKWLVGVTDEAQLHHWFPPAALAWLASKGENVVRYRVPVGDVRDGTYQLMFRKDTAERLA